VLTVVASNLRTPSDGKTAGPRPTGDTGVDGSADHLLYLLEKQPSCLIRVGLDGTLLAVNDVGLKLLGVNSLDFALGRSLGACAPNEWGEFSARVWERGAGSVECDLTDFVGVTKIVEFQGVALRDHPDGIRSILLTVRDRTAVRSIEIALQQQEATQAAEEHARAIAEVRAERERLMASLQAERQRLLAETEAERQRVLTEARSERERALAQTAAQADAEKQRLAAAFAAERDRLVAESKADRERALTDAEGQRQRVLAQAL